jgi:hypothetical protein
MAGSKKLLLKDPIPPWRIAPAYDGRRKRPHSTPRLPRPYGLGGYLRLLAGNFVDDFFVGDVAFDGGLTDEEDGGADC